MVSKFDKLTPDEKVETLHVISSVALMGMFSAYVMLAGRGLLAPEEVGPIFDPLLEKLEAAPISNDESFAKMLEEVGKIKKIAAENWKGK